MGAAAQAHAQMQAFHEQVYQKRRGHLLLLRVHGEAWGRGLSQKGPG